MKNSKSKSLQRFKNEKLENLKKVVGGFRHDPPVEPIPDFNSNRLTGGARPVRD